MNSSSTPVNENFQNNKEKQKFKKILESVTGFKDKAIIKLMTKLLSKENSEDKYIQYKTLDKDFKSPVISKHIPEFLGIGIIVFIATMYNFWELYGIVFDFMFNLLGESIIPLWVGLFLTIIYFGLSKALIKDSNSQNSDNDKNNLSKIIFITLIISTIIFFFLEMTIELGAILTLIISSYLIVILPLELIFLTDNKIVRIKNQAFKLILMLVIFFVFLNISNSLNLNISSPEDQTKVIKENFQENTNPLLDRLGCYFGLKGDVVACINELENEEEVNVISNSFYNIKLEKGVYPSPYTDSNLENPFPVEYTISTSEDMFVEKIECYVNKVSDETFMDVIYLNKEIKGGTRDLPLKNNEGYKPTCNYFGDIIKKIQEKDKTQLNIITVLYFKVDGTLVQTVPIVDYTSFLSLIGDQSGNYFYDYSEIKTRLNIDYPNIDLDLNGYLTNEALNVNQRGLNKELPLVYGDVRDGDFYERPIEFTLNFKPKIDKYNFGKFVSGKITDIKLPPSLVYDGVNENDYVDIDAPIFDNEEFIMHINLKENEDYFVQFAGDMIIYNQFIVNFEANYERKDFISITVDSTAYRENNITTN